MRIEEEYEDVLQNIESAIIRVYRKHIDLLDSETRSAIDVLIQHFNAEQRGKAPSPHSLTGLTKEVAESVKATCEWRLGRAKVTDERGREFTIPPIPLEAIIACLKRIRKSIEFWTKKGGRQGYLNYINQFL